MWRRAPRWVIPIVVFVASCTGSGSPESTSDNTSSTSPTLNVSPPPSFEVESVNRLVTLDQSGNIITIDPDGSNPQHVTDDAQGGLTYFQPVWAPVSGMLAWGQISPRGAGVGLSDGSGGGRREVEMSNLPFYIYWAPDGSLIAALHNAPEVGLEFELVDVDGASSSVVDAGAPYYFSWSPDATSLVTHVGGDRLGIVVPGGETIDLGSTAPGYQAPHWTPAGIFYLDVDGLRIRDLDANSRLLAMVPGPIAFVANPQGTMVAVEALTEDGLGQTAAFQEGPRIPPNVITVIDAATGEIEVATNGPGIGFFWSPDGGSLLTLEPGDAVGEVDISTWVDGETRPLVTMMPPVSFFRDVLQFFDQYAQSLELWAPDSSAVALAGAIDGESGIWVIPVDGSDPRLVSEGTWVAWSNG